MRRFETHDDFFQIIIFVDYNPNEKLVPICDGKKLLDKIALENKINDFGWKIWCKMKTLKGDK